MPKNKGKGPNRRGTVFESPKGSGRWYAQLPPDELGRRPKRSAKSEQEAVKKLAELEAERARGVNPGAKQPTLAAWLRTWLEVLARPNLRPNIYENYVFLVEHYIIPHIGELRLNEITKLHIQQLLNKLRAQGLSPGTVRQVRARLRSALEEAIEAGYITRNHTKTTKVAQTDDDTADMHILTIAQVWTLLESLVKHRLFALYYLALATGMRQGELIGLRWADVDFTKRVIHVKTQLHRRHKAIVRSKPKTKASRRTIPMDDEIYAVLRAHWRNQVEEKRLRGTEWHEHGLVFASEAGTPLFASAVHLHFKGALKKASLPHIRFHDLRHTAASTMLASGVSLADVSEILGHANPGITAKLYLHGSDEGKQRAIETMGRVLKRAQ